MENKRFIWIAAIFTSAIYLIGVITYSISSKIDSLGTLGDFIGGNLNPILSFLTFLILIKTIKYQKDALDTSSTELALTREELELTRTEVKRSADAQEQSKLVLEQQAQTQIIQQFENTFFSLLEQIKSSRPTKDEVDELVRKICSTRYENILMARNALQSSREIHSHFFRLIYQTLKFLNLKQKEISFIEIKFYKNILRSLLTPNETILLGVNSAILPKFSLIDSYVEYKLLIEQYAMLQHMPFRSPTIASNNFLDNYNNIICQTLGCYEISAFNENIYLQRIIKLDNSIIENIKRDVAAI